MTRALLVLALLAGAAQADTLVTFPSSKATLTLGDGWTRQPHTFKGVVEIFKHDAGALLVVTRADVPNPDAWLTDKKQADKKKAYIDKVEAGIKASVPGYKRLAKKLVDANGVPALDLEARREGGTTIVVRVLLFRTYALSAAIEVPKGGDVAAARAIVKAFGPPKS